MAVLVPPSVAVAAPPAVVSGAAVSVSGREVHRVEGVSGTLAPVAAAQRAARSDAQWVMFELALINFDFLPAQDKPIF